MKIKSSAFLLMATFLLLISACTRNKMQVTNGHLIIEIDNSMFSKVSHTLTEHVLFTGFQPTEYIITSTDTLSNFKLESTEMVSIKNNSGNGNSHIYTGKSVNNPSISKTVIIDTYKELPDWAFYKVSYVNSGKSDIVVKKWINHSYSISSRHDKPDFWSLQASSTGERRSWILPVDTGFYQRNYLGMNDPDYGGGIPVLDIWRKDAGIAIGHTALLPLDVEMPVEMKKQDSCVSIMIGQGIDITLHPGDTLHTCETFVSVHKGDCFTSLKQYASIMEKRGIIMPASEPLAFEPMWCAWGYMRKFTLKEVLGTLPKVKDMGFTWVTIDDGYQQAEGDWKPNSTTFPEGENQMKALVDTIHSYGFKAQLWWAPLAADPGCKLLTQNPELIIRNKNGEPQKISWWDSYYLSPAYEPVLKHTGEMVNMFINSWGFDGLKLDGQHLNACPPDFNPSHALANSEMAPQSVPAFFKLIYETARSLKPTALVQLCPCGCAMSFYNLPYTNQTVASDPIGSTQVRSKGKVYKALAPRTAYFGDHVELSDNRSDFASTIGVGAVPGTKFTWPADNPFAEEKNLLTPEREKEWKKWITIYKQHQLSTGEYLGGLYDIGYDIPETHVIMKGDTLFYAFYNKEWKGNIQMKGLKKNKYAIYDYVDGKSLGTIQKSHPELQVNFTNYLLLMAYPIQ